MLPSKNRVIIIIIIIIIVISLDSVITLINVASINKNFAYYAIITFESV